MKINNTTKSDLGLNHEITVPSGGSIDMDGAAFKLLAKGSLVVRSWLESGALMTGDQPEDQPEDQPKAG